MQDEPSESPLLGGNEPAAFAAGDPLLPPNPAWAKDLRKLYKSVVEEPLPDSFMALLSQLNTDE